MTGSGDKETGAGRSNHQFGGRWSPRMKCPHCESEMQAGTVRIAISAIASALDFLWGNLYFTPTGKRKQEVLFEEEVPRAAYRCLRCHAVVLLDSPPSERKVCIGEQQQAKAPRRAVYDCLRKHRIPHPVASEKANGFHGGLQVDIPLQEKDRAQTMVDELRGLGLVAKVIEPVFEKQKGRKT
jgi:hypothetical protein